MDKKEQWNAYMRQWNQKRKDASPRSVCACGCGEEIPTIRSDGKPQRYAPRHSAVKGKKLGWRKEHVTEWYSRARAREIKGPGPCELEHIGGCGGENYIQVHHLNVDPHNNRLENLMRLCVPHHKLVEHGRIDLDDPVMPKFFVSGGVRRYEYSYPYTRKRTM